MAGFKQVPIRRFLTLKRLSEATSYIIPAGALLTEAAAFSRNGEAFSVTVGTAAGGSQIATVAGTATQVARVSALSAGQATGSAVAPLTVHITPAEGNIVDFRLTYDEYLDSNGKQPDADGNEYLKHDPV